MLEITLQGALISGGLIIAIGAQNAFVLKQGLLKNHIFYICLVCFLYDFAWISVGVLGFGSWVSGSKMLVNALALGGVGFLLYYSYTSFRNAYKGGHSLEASDATTNNQATLAKAILATLAVTVPNPHLYLDTVMIIGGIASTLTQDAKIYFLLGASLSSFIWFFALGYGARLLIPLFRKRVTWRVLDFAIGCIMLFIALGLVHYVLNNQP